MANTTDPLVVLPIPYRDPVAAFLPFVSDPVAVFFDTPGAGGRYSFIAATPFQVIVADAGGVRIDGWQVAGDPFSVLEAALARYRRPSLPGLPPFQTGAAGVFGYELGRHLERLPPPRAADLGWPDMVVGLYDTVAAFDHHTCAAWVFSATKSQAEAMAVRLAAAPLALPPLDWGPRASWDAEISRDAYQTMVRRVIDLIVAGDVFQVNISQRLSAVMPDNLDPFMLYRRLRALNPAPLAGWFGGGEGLALLSASPEGFLALRSDGHVATRPIKGTMPRGLDAEVDHALALALVESAKDRAENLMIVDLLRNDLAKVCSLGSISVPRLCELESFATVHHLVSVVEGWLRPEFSAIDLLRATFPGGSITGCPKIRAMEIIHEMEPVRRGPYCGAAAWLGFDGAMEANIIIRSLVVSGRRVVAQAGGGIVADSDPAAEYEETITKVTPLLRALDP